MRLFIPIATALVLTSGMVYADETRDAESASSPYAGEQQRRIKAMSSEQIASLLRGDGMGFALAAELNSYPGPRHVLELADELALSEQQRADTRALFDAMRAEAIRLGEEVVAAEAQLDAAFAGGSINASSLGASLMNIAALHGHLRNTHLQAHLLQKQLLSAEQVGRYNELRGYTTGEHDHQRHVGGHSAPAEEGE